MSAPDDAFYIPTLAEIEARPADPEGDERFYEEFMRACLRPLDDEPPA